MNGAATPPVGIGASAPRIEDDALLRGAGCFTDDLHAPGAAHALMVRSPYAHARIRELDASDARSVPGVLAVLTGEDVTQVIRERLGVAGRDGALPPVVTRPLIPAERVLHVGDIVAVVVAESEAAARDAAERVAVDYEEMPAAPTARAALDAPALWPEMEDNVLLDWEAGDSAACDEAFALAAHVVELDIGINRVSAACMETRGAVAHYDALAGQYVVHAPTQGANLVRDRIAATLGVAAADVRVLTHDVGGAFGIKIPSYPEYALVAIAARRLGRTVKWVGDRSDSFVSDGQCRDHRAQATLALDATGRMLGVRCEILADVGAYPSATSIAIPTRGGVRCLLGVYDVPVFHARTRVAVSHSVPVVSYRGAGKPEFNYIIERLVDAAARELGFDPVALRRINAFPPEAMPASNAVGLTFDSGEFVANMDAALARADRDGFADRRAESAARGRLRGFGFALFQEPDGPIDCRLSLGFDAAGELTVSTTSQTGGQGHATFLAQLAATYFGLPGPSVRVVQGDSDRIGPGDGTGGSNLATVTGTAFVKASERIVERAKAIAGGLLEANASDVEFEAGEFRVVGTDASVPLADVARAAFEPGREGVGSELGLDALVHYKGPAYSYPCGCHVCEVEIDPETGRLALLRYVAVDDHGVAINPMLLEGQAHGGIAQGIGQVLLERIAYDADSGQLLTGSFLDYCVPRADDLPALEFENRPVPCLTNALGAKGVGESGCTGALPAVMNAVIDALAERGVRQLDLPVHDERIWAACRAGAST